MAQAAAGQDHEICWPCVEHPTGRYSHSDLGLQWQSAPLSCCSAVLCRPHHESGGHSLRGAGEVLLNPASACYCMSGFTALVAAVCRHSGSGGSGAMHAPLWVCNLPHKLVEPGESTKLSFLESWRDTAQHGHPVVEGRDVETGSGASVCPSSSSPAFLCTDSSSHVAACCRQQSVLSQTSCSSRMWKGLAMPCQLLSSRARSLDASYW